MVGTLEITTWNGSRKLNLFENEKREEKKLSEQKENMENEK